MTWTPDPAFDAGSIFAIDTALCQVRLQDDGRWPWLILLPRVDGAVELTDLPVKDQGRLMGEIARASEAVRAMGERIGRPVEKMNVAALGNVTPQLHVHVIGRRTDDAAWPAPVWGVGAAEPLHPALRDDLLTLIRESLASPPTD